MRKGSSTRATVCLGFMFLVFAAALADLPPSDLEIDWGGTFSNPNALGRPFPGSSQVVMTPIVVNLTDDNGDGIIDGRDNPEIVFVTYDDNSTLNGVIRAIHGGGPSKGADYFATCGATTWKEGDPLSLPCTLTDAVANPRAGIAAGDIDGDGVPEIVVITETGGIQILDNRGNILSTSATIRSVVAPAVSIANVDNAGFAEIVFANHVITLEHGVGGNLQVLDVFTGTQGIGANGGAVVSCVANITGDNRQEIVAGTALYEFPRPPAGVTRRAQCTGAETVPEEIAFCNGQLVVLWDAAVVQPIAPEGVCAIADVLGVDPPVAPGPANPLDGVPEIILIQPGKILIVDASGVLQRSISFSPTVVGGAPAVSDTDGDGFPEITTTFRTFYVVTDLQDTTAACPAWPTPAAGDAVTPAAVNTPRTPPGNSCSQDSDCSAVSAGTVCLLPSGQCICEHNGWLRTIENDTVGTIGSSGAFDFSGDGTPEVAVHDECRLRLYRARDGAVLFSNPSEARSRIQYPVVADVDLDGRAELVVAVNNESGQCSEGATASYNNGLEVWGNASWGAALPSWNQYSYEFDNINDDNSIPLLDTPSWIEHNTYRTNLVSRPSDLAVTLSDSADPVLLGQSVTYTMTVFNEGPARSNARLMVVLPAELAFLGATAGCTEDQGTVTCPIAGLESGSMLVFSVDASTAAAGLATVVASVSGPVDPDPVDNTASETTRIDPVVVGDRVWHDQDGDGLQDGTEPGMPGALVSLHDGVSGNPLAATFTDPTGLYTFGGLSIGGNYYLRFTPPIDFVPTLSGQGSDDALDSDADPITFRTPAFVLEDAADATIWDAGMIPSCSAPDEPIYLYEVTLSSEGNDHPVLHFQDGNQPSQITGYNVYRSSDASVPFASWPQIASDVVDMDEGMPNRQWVDTSGDPSPSGTWYYQVTAFNHRCPAEGPF